MSFGKLPVRAGIVGLSVVVALAMGTYFTRGAVAQEDGEAARTAAFEKLGQMLDELNAFSKALTDNNGNKFYNVVWEMDDETTKMTLQIRQVGQTSGKPVFALFAWTTVAAVSEGKLPPAVVQLVAFGNDSLFLGNYSTDEQFTTVYAASTGILNTMSSDDLWMYLAYLHGNRLSLKKKIDAIVGG